MFAKGKETVEPVARPPQRRSGPPPTAPGMPSIIGPDMVVTGNLATPGEVHVEGRIDGDVSCARLVVGATGAVHGAVSAESVRVHGRVEGSIRAEEVFLLSGSHTIGDIVQASLEISPGALFEGTVRRRGSEEVAPPAALPAPTPPAPAQAAPAQAAPAQPGRPAVIHAPAPAAPEPRPEPRPEPQAVAPAPAVPPVAEAPAAAAPEAEVPPAAANEQEVPAVPDSAIPPAADGTEPDSPPTPPRTRLWGVR